MEKLDIMEYSFKVGAGKRQIIDCEIEKPFKLYAYRIDRERSETFSIWFDGEDQKHLNADRYFLVLDKPTTLTEMFSFISSNIKNPLPDMVEVKLIGEFL
ncbi:hypothetical protein [Lentibacillus cibarius]|uniref:Uncharacterized protein n=1 Tax=Lentibacillus cibarius TaxID=2583219 RepID=A0A5S3QN44_9BACI|nr:hypothetical protein [Lentibacillus cibarius]TMN23157.1 hypothetical protein FFL34_14465 [Lentibacillus cibarius]